MNINLWNERGWNGLLPSSYLPLCILPQLGPSVPPLISAYLQKAICCASLFGLPEIASQ